MKQFFKEHYKSILSSIIAAVLVSVLLWFFRTFVAINILAKAAGVLCIKFNMPLYIAVLIFIAGLSCPFLFKKKKLSCSQEYDRDEVHGLVWEWSNNVYPKHFTPLCPKCLAELPIRGNYQQVYYCVSCGFKKESELVHNNMLKLVRIEIEKRERTEEWKDAEQRIKAIKNKTERT